MERKLSVLILSPYPHIRGGVSAYAETLKAHLRHCDVTAFGVGSPTDNENIFSLVWRLLNCPVKIVLLARRRKLDVVHLNPSLNVKALIRDGLIVAALVLSGYRRTMIFFHGWDDQLRQKIAANFALKTLFVALINRCARVLVLAPEFRTALRDMGVDEGRIILSRTMVDVRQFCLPTTVSKERHTILFMSRFDRRKGCYELLEAFAKLAGAFPDWDLVLSGDGEEKESLQRSIATLGLQGRVLMPGYVTGQSKIDLLQQCDVFALPTYYPEGMPIALLEAMAVGKPVLTAKTGGIAHIARHRENGVVLDRVTVETVTEGLRVLVSDEALRIEMGRRNAAIIAQKFDAPIVTAEIETLYQQVTAA